MAITSLKSLLAPDQAAAQETATSKTLADLYVYDTIADIPTEYILPGTKALSKDGNTLHVWTGNAWSTVATLTGLTITQGAEPSYTFAADGTPVVITFTASDTVTWSYSVTSGSLTNGGGTTATIEQAGNVFTITPSTDKTYDGTFTVNFVGTGSAGVVGDVSEFSLRLGFYATLKYTLDNPNPYGTSASDYFGYSVSISESYAIVGAYGEDDAGGTESGKAYIFSTATGQLLYTLDNPTPYGTSAGDGFGLSVSISESYAIVGAHWEGDPGGNYSGKAYIYSTATGNLLYTLDNPNAYGTSFNDVFGRSVSISESYAIVSAPYEDDVGGTTSGKAYIYSTANGSLLHTLDNPNAYGTSAGDLFGQTVSISESYAIVSAPYEDDVGGTQSGKAYIYSTTTGQLLHTLDNPNAYSTSAGDNFGYSVSISESYAIVGAYQEDDAGGIISGKAYIYSTATGQLLHTLDNPTAYGTSYGDQFGYSVSISESYAIVGASDEDDAGGTGSGKAYIYSTATGQLLYTLDNPNAYGTSLNDNFGWSVSISESYAIVGAYREDDAGGTESGKAYIYK